jgi:hypothetical protein
MAPIVTTSYWKITGVEERPDDSLAYTLRQVADFEGTPIELGALTAEHETAPGEPELSRGTILKIVTSVNREVTVNPTD